MMMTLLTHGTDPSEVNPSRSRRMTSLARVVVVLGGLKVWTSIKRRPEPMNERRKGFWISLLEGD
jgi:hypothetical protein